MALQLTARANEKNVAHVAMPGAILTYHQWGRGEFIFMAAGIRSRYNFGRFRPRICTTQNHNDRSGPARPGFCNRRTLLPSLPLPLPLSFRSPRNDAAGSGTQRLRASFPEVGSGRRKRNAAMATQLTNNGLGCGPASHSPVLAWLSRVRHSVWRWASTSFRIGWTGVRRNGERESVAILVVKLCCFYHSGVTCLRHGRT